MRRSTYDIGGIETFRKSLHRTAAIAQNVSVALVAPLGSSNVPVVIGGTRVVIPLIGAAAAWSTRPLSRVAVGEELAVGHPDVPGGGL